MDFAPLPMQRRRRADIVFTRRRLAVFIDGGFWHRCPVHATMPATNQEFWRGKLERNKARDADTNSALEAAGWTVLRIWEHVPSDDASLVESALTRLDGSPGRMVR